jgi:cytosine/adenosine deaminase-related metal-dependent hydrolase
VIVRARIVLPIVGPPVENGAVVITEGRVTAVERWNARLAAGGEVIDLGEAVVLPGLVNAHCHLDYTAMAGQIDSPRSFADWIKLITTIKNSWNLADYRESWLRGADMLLQGGVTTVGDIEANPTLLPEVLSRTPLRVCSFLELIGIKDEPSPARLLEETLQPIASLASPRGTFGLSPHALYSTTPELLRHSARFARQKRWRMTTHVAESEEEFNMFMYSDGPMHAWLKRQRDMTDCGQGSPVKCLDGLGLLDEQFLAVHVNYLWHGDAALLGERKVSVAHCPRSHAYFGHRAFPHLALEAAGVNLCLGTDSLATVRKRRGQPLALDMFAELQSFAATTSVVAPDKILRMATANGARALGLQGQAGELSPGAWADLIAVPFCGLTAAATEAVIHHTGRVAASMIGGQWAIEPQQTDE